MKIRHIFSLALGAVVMLMSSCQKPLEMAPDGRISIDSVFRNPDMVGAYLNTCYANIQFKNFDYFFTTNWFIAACDEAYDADAEAEAGLTVNQTLIGNVSAATSVAIRIDANRQRDQYLWNTYWTQIRRCNLFLSKIGDAPLNNEEDRAKWTAEVHVLRAYFYMELMKLYGGKLPLMSTVIPYDGDFSTVDIQRSTSWELAQFIIADCDSALVVEGAMPWRRTQSPERMRMTNAVAWAIKSRTVLYAASPLFNDGENRWEEAYKVTKGAYEALRDNGYELYKRAKSEMVDEYTNEYAFIAPAGYPEDNATAAAYINEYFTTEYQYTGSDNPVDKETIWQHNGGVGTPWNIQGIGAQGLYKCGLCPTQELVDAYETLNGESILDRNTPYRDKQHLDPVYNLANTQYDRENPYTNRDPRFYASIYYHLSQRYTYWSFKRQEWGEGTRRTEVIDLTNNEAGNPIGADLTNVLPNARTRSRTGYYTRKYLSPQNGSSGINKPAPGWKHFRFAEIILNYAEAAAEAGYLDEARDAVNLVRDRVFMPHIDEADQAALITRIRGERRVELAFEEHRYFDIRRWTAPNGDLSQYHQYLTAMQISRDGNGGYIYERVPTIKCRDGASYNNWQNKFLFAPLPLNEVSRIQAGMGQNWQNPGW